MREIKFRVLNEDGTVIGYEMFNISFGWHQTILNDRPCDDGTLPVRSGAIVDGIDNLIRNQYTGLKDKNNKEVFEGDILKWRCSKSGKKKERMYTVTIDWRDGGHGYCLTIHDGGEKWATNKSYWNAFDREIIGNIYKNPELLN